MWSISWLFVLEAVGIVAGNIMTIVIVTTTPRLRRKQYVLIVSLAVVDLLVGLVSLPMSILYDEYLVARLKTVYRRVYFVQDFALGTASLLGLQALALERAHATYFPYKHNTLTKVPYIVGIAVMWVLVVIIGITSYALYIQDLNDYARLKLVTVAALLIGITASYFLIFVNVRCMKTASNHVIQQDNKKLTITLAIVTTISLCAWLPNPVFMYFWEEFIPLFSRKTFLIIRSISKVLHYSNSLANFVIYAFRMREFKKEILRRIGCVGRNQVTPRNGVQVGTMSTTNERRKVLKNLTMDKRQR